MYTVTFFYVMGAGEEAPWTKPFAVSDDDLERYKTEARDIIAAAERPNAPPGSPPPDGYRILDEEGVTVFRYPPTDQ